MMRVRAGVDGGSGLSICKLKFNPPLFSALLTFSSLSSGSLVVASHLLCC